MLETIHHTVNRMKKESKAMLFYISTVIIITFMITIILTINKTDRVIEGNRDTERGTRAGRNLSPYAYQHIAQSSVHKHTHSSTFISRKLTDIIIVSS